jgi:hypothetical protein
MSKNPTRSAAHLRLVERFPTEAPAPAQFVCADFESRRPLFYRPTLAARIARAVRNLFRKGTR